jgi:hypothetical protein
MEEIGLKEMCKEGPPQNNLKLLKNALEHFFEWL